MADELDAVLEEAALEVEADNLDAALASALEELGGDAAAATAAPPAAKKSKAKKNKKKAKDKPKASAAFVSSKKKAADLVSGEAPSFLDADSAALWQQVLSSSDPRPTQQGPFSRAYRSFSVKGEGVAVHLGSAAAAAGKEAAGGAAGGRGRGHSPAPPEVNVEKKAALRLYQTTLGNAMVAAGTVEPTMSTAANVETKARLTQLYLQQLAVDLRARVAGNPDFDAQRFSATAARILA